MAIEPYEWPAVGEFCNRRADLDALEEWWATDSREPINMYGRRRVGKSWLFRRFAHGKPAVLLVAEADASPTRALRRFAEALEPHLGVRPSLADVGELIRVLYRMAEQQKALVVVDEFPYLLGSTKAARMRTLSAVQGVMEQERDSSKIKLILAGSVVAEMERLQEPKSPLYGRLRPLDVRPLSFREATAMLGDDPVSNLTRYAVAGGMPRYLSALGTGSLREAVAVNVLDRRSGLFNEPLALMRNEVRDPTAYFAILEALSGGARPIGDISAELGGTSQELTRYLETLLGMRLAERSIPIGAGSKERKTLWRCSDNFVRFWFRFVRPFQSELEAGADARAYYDSAVAPYLNDHAAPVFEQQLREWARTAYAGQVRQVGAWWGNALHVERRAKRRFTEEVDLVGVAGKKVVVAGEAKWTNKVMPRAVYSDLVDYKLPALAQAGFDISATSIVLASRGGFSKALHDEAAADGRLRLMLAADVLA